MKEPMIAPNPAPRRAIKYPSLIISSVCSDAFNRGSTFLSGWHETPVPSSSTSAQCVSQLARIVHKNCKIKVLRQTSPVFAPASCSRKIPMICSSVNRLGFMSIPSHVMDFTHFGRDRGAQVSDFTSSRSPPTIAHSNSHAFNVSESVRSKARQPTLLTNKLVATPDAQPPFTKSPCPRRNGWQQSFRRGLDWRRRSWRRCAARSIW